MAFFMNPGLTPGADIVPLNRITDPDLPAGEFSAWLIMMDRAIAGSGESDVPCGDCNACCRGAYFIAVSPADTSAIKRIPAELLFDAPGAPAGFQILGYNEAGSCPLLKEDACSIYLDRPATCRTYDCRIFAATGLAERDPAKAAIISRAARWRFDYADDVARESHQALIQGAAFLVEHYESLADLLPSNATQLAMLCVRLHKPFARLSRIITEDPDQALTTLRAELRSVAGR